jgi:hypothetical protein
LRVGGMCWVRRMSCRSLSIWSTKTLHGLVNFSPNPEAVKYCLIDINQDPTAHGNSRLGYSNESKDVPLINWNHWSSIRNTLSIRPPLSVMRHERGCLLRSLFNVKVS